MNVRRSIQVLSIAVALAACAPGISTKRAEMPELQRGPIEVVVHAEPTVQPEDISKAKIRFKQSFRDAGFEPVEIKAARSGQAWAIEIVLEYESATPSKNSTVAAGVGCVYFCPLLAPCLLLPVFYAPQFEVSADVAVHQNGRLLFGEFVSERAVSSANLIETGDEEFRNKLEELAVHNFTANIVGRIAAGESRTAQQR